jgi:transcriptional regulator with XRE-family HTH domain
VLKRQKGGNPHDVFRKHQIEGRPVMVPAPPIRRRLVGKALRRYRENLGYTLGDVAKILECDRSKVSRVETGQRGIRGKELRELLSDYGASEEQQAILCELADPRGAFGWFREYSEVLPGAWQDYLILETAAAKITGYEAQRIPGLLQTRAYARALAETEPALKDDVARDRAADAVIARQRAICKGERCPETRLIIGQAALHQQVGGPDVMREQLGYLAQVAGSRNAITVQVLEFESGAHAAAGDGSLAILHITEAMRLGVVHLGGVGGGVCLEDRHDLEAYAEVFDQLRAFALTPALSARLLRRLARD